MWRVSTVFVLVLLCLTVAARLTSAEEAKVLTLKNDILIVNKAIPRGFRFHIITLRKVKVVDAAGKEVARKDIPKVLKKGITVEITKTGNRVAKIQVKKKKNNN